MNVVGEGEMKMNVNLKQAGLALLIVGLAAYLYGRYMTPAKIETRTEIQEREVVKRDIVTVIREIINPDGTKEIVTTITDNTKETKKSSSKTVQTDIKLAKDWAVGISAKTNIPYSNIEYSLSVDRRVFCNFFITGSISTDKQAGLGLKMEF